MTGPRLTTRAHELVAIRLRAGDLAIDATVGNGHDTLFLARAVGKAGLVYGFDRQDCALAAAGARLSHAGLADSVRLFCSGHEAMTTHVRAEHHGRVAAVMFNLGYLPGGDRSIVTEPPTTLAALESAMQMVRAGGVISVLVYVGHAGGHAELAAVRAWAESRRAMGWDVVTESRDAPRSPVLFAAVRP